MSIPAYGIEMLAVFLFVVLAAYASTLHVVSKRKMSKRIRAMEQDLQSFADVISKIVEVQTTTFHKLTTRFDHLEERLMDLSVPSQDAELPLERRHQMLALARQGVAMKDIAKRLKTPVGEAELVVNLRKFLDKENARPVPANKQVSPYV